MDESRTTALSDLIIFLIGLYQRWISPALGPHCRFFPSCSDYVVQAVSARGALAGLFLGAKRLARCQPFSSGGHDPVAHHG